MFNNPVLDVAIGLAFIFVLYSLLATTIKEFIATIFSYRGKMLERGIEQMMDGVNYKYFWWSRVKNFFLELSQKKKINARICQRTNELQQEITNISAQLDADKGNAQLRAKLAKKEHELKEHKATRIFFQKKI